MSTPLSNLRQAVDAFSGAISTLTPYELGLETWAWEEYIELRYAPLHAALGLEELAVRLIAAREAAGHPVTQAQRILGLHQAAWRALTGRLVGLDEAAANAQPSPTEWPIRRALVHALETEAAFYASILSARRDLKTGAEPQQVKRDEREALVGVKLSDVDGLPYAELLDRFTDLHERVQTTLADLSDEELEIPSVFWESKHYPIRFRLHRFAAHLKEHTNQVDQILAGTGRAPGEGMQLVYQIHGALAEVEGALLGAPSSAETDQALLSLAATLDAQRESALASVADTKGLLAAAAAGDVAAVQSLLSANKLLANARDEAGLSALMLALYNGHQPIADAIMAAGPEGLRFSDYAAGGAADTVGEWLDWSPALLDKAAVDGYNALQLASFFGRLPVVELLLQHGANVHIASDNAMGVQPIHAAAAGQHFEVLMALVEAGADVNAEQKSGFRPLDSAVQNGNEAMAAYLRERGAQASAR